MGGRIANLPKKRGVGAGDGWPVTGQCAKPPQHSCSEPGLQQGDGHQVFGSSWHVLCRHKSFSEHSRSTIMCCGCLPDGNCANYLWALANRLNTPLYNN